MHTKDPESLLDEQYPRTIAALTEMGALDHLDRIIRLDKVWNQMRSAKDRSTVDARLERMYQVLPQLRSDNADLYDLIYAGGGLGLLHAAVMAQNYKYRVVVFDRGEVGCAHREWNISREELKALVEIGLFTWDELHDIVMTEYDAGIVRFYTGPNATPTELRMRHVLDVALDAGALLRLARRKVEAAGGTVLDQREFRRVLVNANGLLRVVVEVAHDNEIERYAGRLLLDGMGSSSPLALRRFGAQPFAGVCPTVGTVVEGLVKGSAPNEHNPDIGDILVSVADAQRGQQYMWEGFPGRDDQLTIYLFYYDTLNNRRKANDQRKHSPSLIVDRSSPSLMQLFEDYFTLLPTYKLPGPHFRHLKPVYGYIPARHTVRQQEAPLLRGVVPVGDSAAQQSPLTFCGFGSHVRNLDRTTSLLHQALLNGLIDPGHLYPISAYQVNVSLNWIFSRFMQPWSAPDDVNKLQGTFLLVLSDLGEELARRFFRDQMRWSDYHQMLIGVFRRSPSIILIVWRVLGPAGIWQWIGDYRAYSSAALEAWVGRRLGARGRSAMVAMIGRLAPSLGLRLQARFAEWSVMKWV